MAAPGTVRVLCCSAGGAAGGAASGKWVAPSVAAALAAERVLAGGLVALATDTVYGVAGLAQSDAAVSAIYRLKRRHPGKPLAVCLSRVQDVARWGQVEEGEGDGGGGGHGRLISALLPGPVTLLLRRTTALNPQLNAGQSLVGVRVPPGGLVCDVARLCAERGPLALTSANTSGSGSCLRAEEFSELWPQLSLVLDSGAIECGDRGGSTVVDVSTPYRYRVVRDGCALTNTQRILHEHGWSTD